MAVPDFVCHHYAAVRQIADLDFDWREVLQSPVGALCLERLHFLLIEDKFRSRGYAAFRTPYRVTPGTPFVHDLLLVAALGKWHVGCVG